MGKKVYYSASIDDIQRVDRTKTEQREPEREETFGKRKPKMKAYKREKFKY